MPAMFFLGVLFAVIWWAALSQGARIEREQAEYRAHAAASDAG